MLTIPRCRRCGAQHRTWHALAKCRFCRSGHDWTAGNARYASVAFCPRCVTVFMYPTLQEALDAKAAIDAGGCGGMCHRNHKVFDLAAGGAA